MSETKLSKRQREILEDVAGAPDIALADSAALDVLLSRDLVRAYRARSGEDWTYRITEAGKDVLGYE